MKKPGLILTTLVLFSLSLYLAFVQGGAGLAEQRETLSHLAAPVNISPVIYTGIRATVANGFADLMNGLMSLMGNSVLWSIVLLALLVELILLYPSVRIQLKQKKIHLFHKKLVDRFERGELAYSETKDELHKLYAVNEKIHSRGAVLVVIQVALIFMVLWGLNLLVHVPALLQGSWNVLNFSLLSRPVDFVIPLLASLLYFFHALIKIDFKEKEDYLSPVQIWGAITFAVLGAFVIYWAAGIFAVALTIYFTTLLAFATIRYIVVESKARAWGKLAQKELLADLRAARPHKNRFEYISRKWNHLPVIRHLNFHLLEEAVSMSLGLLLALNFFGVFQGQENLTARVPAAYALPLNSITCQNPYPGADASCTNVTDFFSVMTASSNDRNFSFPYGDLIYLQPMALGGDEGIAYFVFSKQKDPLNSGLPELCCVATDPDSPDNTILAKKPVTILPTDNVETVVSYSGPEGACGNDLKNYHNTPEEAVCKQYSDETSCKDEEVCYWTGTSCRPAARQYNSNKTGCLNAGYYYNDNNDQCAHHLDYWDGCLYQTSFTCPAGFAVQRLVNGKWTDFISTILSALGFPVPDPDPGTMNVVAGATYRLRVQNTNFENAFTHQLDGNEAVESYVAEEDTVQFKIADKATIGAADSFAITDKFSTTSCTANINVVVTGEKVQKIVPPSSPNWVGNDVHLTPGG